MCRGLIDTLHIDYGSPAVFTRALEIRLLHRIV